MQLMGESASADEGETSQPYPEKSKKIKEEIKI